MCKHLQSLKEVDPQGAGSLNPKDINLVGSVETVIARAAALREAGVTHLFRSVLRRQ
jgi:hypothetical protein